MSSRIPTVLDLFCGAGGMSLGFHAEGARTVGAVDFNAIAPRTFEKMFAEESPRVFAGPVDGDISQMDLEALLASLPKPPDLVVGGPPCQSFSRIGRAKQRALLEEEQRRALEDDEDYDDWEDEGDREVDPAAKNGIRNAERMELYKYFLKVVRLARPLAFVIENVPGMSEGGGAGIDYARRLAREAAVQGYQVRYFQPNAVHFGVPQFRRRFFFVGFRSDLGVRAIPKPPVPTHYAHIDGPDPAASSDDPWFLPIEMPPVETLLPAVTVAQAIGDLPKLKGHLERRGVPGKKPVDGPLPLRREPSAYVKMLRRWPGFETDGPVLGNWYRWNGRDFQIFKRMAQGDRYPEAIGIGQALFQDELRRRKAEGQAPVPETDAFNALRAEFVPIYRNDAFHDKWHKLLMDQPSWTVTAHLRKDGYSHIHYDSRQARTITIREAARLQSFPDGFNFEGNSGEQFQQIGNAVPPLLARAIAKQVLTQLRALGAFDVPELHKAG